ncbi:L,D-transpeptidase family protein [Desulfobulbus alkaliphilus]|uniref:L,D-transpeptidase family protein n=1 Tax=Desulfobulbus alkaliphilus TaxID=869814 RepID=UPI00196430AF|nr:murein L,D-transpeptidase [Desulfobulbus alkaliphilus]MBM9537477.1 murein L,D-transpeptidase [Desulfobulbus alkaliphilus]
MNQSQFHPSPGHPLLILFLLTFLFTVAPSSSWCSPPTNPRLETILASTWENIRKDLHQNGFSAGQPIFIRIFKLPGTLELWMDKGQNFELFKTYRICSYSGFPGPKRNQGDWQAPEGFYSVSAEQMNPNSSFHLSFDIGYPNAFDTHRNRTGSLIMVHGECRSVGCFAMSNHRIEEIYLLAHEALRQGQEQFSVHIFPFPLTADNLQKYAASPWIGFWKSLEPGFSAFENSRQVPKVLVENGEYVIVPRASQWAMTPSSGRKR